MQGIPINQQALVATQGKTWRLRTDMAVPQPRDDEVLIKISAVALNPSDVKLVEHAEIEGAVAGCDFAGTVTMVGRNVGKKLEVGDRVSAFVYDGSVTRSDNGAFAEYVVAKAEFCINLSYSMTFAEAASWNIGLMTCGLAFRSLGLVDEFGDVTITATALRDSTRAPILVYGEDTDPSAALNSSRSVPRLWKMSWTTEESVASTVVVRGMLQCKQ
jgi:aspyridone synthetase trans-acting enoyl reductase